MKEKIFQILKLDTLKLNFPIANDINMLSPLDISVQNSNFECARHLWMTAWENSKMTVNDYVHMAKNKPLEKKNFGDKDSVNFQLSSKSSQDVLKKFHEDKADLDKQPLNTSQILKSRPQINKFDMQTDRDREIEDIKLRNKIRARSREISKYGYVKISGSREFTLPLKVKKSISPEPHGFAVERGKQTVRASEIVKLPPKKIDSKVEKFKDQWIKSNLGEKENNKEEVTIDETKQKEKSPEIPSAMISLENKPVSKEDSLASQSIDSTEQKFSEKSRCNSASAHIEEDNENVNTDIKSEKISEPEVPKVTDVNESTAVSQEAIFAQQSSEAQATKEKVINAVSPPPKKVSNWPEFKRQVSFAALPKVQEMPDSSESIPPVITSSKPSNLQISKNSSTESISRYQKSSFPVASRPQSAESNKVLNANLSKEKIASSKHVNEKFSVAVAARRKSAGDVQVKRLTKRMDSKPLLLSKSNENKENLPWYADKSKSFHNSFHENLSKSGLRKIKKHQDSNSSTSSEKPWYQDKKRPLYENLKATRPVSHQVSRQQISPTNITRRKLFHTSSTLTFDLWLKKKVAQTPKQEKTEIISKEVKQEKANISFQKWLHKKIEQKKLENYHQETQNFDSIKKDPAEIALAFTTWLKKKENIEKLKHDAEKLQSKQNSKAKSELEHKKSETNLKAFTKWLNKKVVLESKAWESELDHTREERQALEEKSTKANFKLAAERIAKLLEANKELKKQVKKKHRKIIRSRSAQGSRHKNDENYQVYRRQTTDLYDVARQLLRQTQSVDSTEDEVSKSELLELLL